MRLRASSLRRYLLLEDDETGEVLIPLIYMKSVLGSHYSRKLSSLKYRLVMVPDGSELSLLSQGRQLYWQWALESSPDVRMVIENELGEVNTPKVRPVHESCLADAPCHTPLMALACKHVLTCHLAPRVAGPPLLGAAAHRVQCSGPDP